MEWVLPSYPTHQKRNNGLNLRLPSQRSLLRPPRPVHLRQLNQHNPSLRHETLQRLENDRSRRYNRSLFLLRLPGDALIWRLSLWVERDYYLFHIVADGHLGVDYDHIPYSDAGEDDLSGD